MIDGQFTLPDDSPAAMRTIRQAIAGAAEKMASAVESVTGYDVGRLRAAVDFLQQAKDVACQAVILPFAPAAVDGPVIKEIRPPAAK